jgi:hypothetical protein
MVRIINHEVLQLDRVEGKKRVKISYGDYM